VTDLAPIVPTSQREFARTGILTAFFRANQGGEDALTPVPVRVRIMDAASRTVFDQGTALQAADFVTGRAAELRIDLPVPQLAPGQYLLTIDATRGATEAVRRDVRFAVR
jgi:hypothetical protein